MQRLQKNLERGARHTKTKEEKPIAKCPACKSDQVQIVSVTPAVGATSNSRTLFVRIEPSEDGFDASQKFSGIKGFDHVIICSRR